jgi:chemotaxis protein methyltransferase WspC
MKLRQLLKDATGLVLSQDAVERAVREHMPQLEPGERHDYAPLPGTPAFESLVDLVTVPESWMFRDPEVFGTALHFVQRRLLSHPGRQLRVLCVPCAGGEEPYSLAMALARAGVTPGQCRIDAIDLSQAALARARLGRYTRNAFRNADLAFRERWFRRDGDAYLIDDALRPYVCFSQGNLLTLPPPNQEMRYDLVFCRNLLIYFDDAGRAAAARAVEALLLDDGLLLSGCAEAPAFCRGGFAPQSLGATYALQKQAVATLRRRPRSAAAAPPAPPAPLPLAGPRTHAVRHGAGASPAAPTPAVGTVTTPAALLDEARRLADAGRLPDAERACQEALALEPGLAEAWFLLGVISECGGHSGKNQVAERHLRRCLYLQPDHYGALCALALLHERRGDALDAALLRQRAARAHARHANAGAQR